MTAAGYDDAARYYSRLQGLLTAMSMSVKTGALSDPTLLVMGGESNYLFAFDAKAPYLLRQVPRESWLLPAMASWTDATITALLDTAEAALRECVRTLNLPADVLRKERAVGIIPTVDRKFTREQLEETVLVTSQLIESSPVGQTIPFCAFNGGNDVFVDIGDKSWGVRACQRFLGGIDGAHTLHVGDQFLSAGANDFKARIACTTAWIASPEETASLLDELHEHMAPPYCIGRGARAKRTDDKD